MPQGFDESWTIINSASRFAELITVCPLEDDFRNFCGRSFVWHDAISWIVVMLGLYAHPLCPVPTTTLPASEGGLGYTFDVIAEGASAMAMSPLLLASGILLLPSVLTVTFCCAILQIREVERRTVWIVYRGFGRFVLALTVAVWWVMWDLREHTELPPWLARNWLWALETSTAAALFFSIAPVICLGIFLVSCYIVDKAILKQRWSFTEILSRAWWRLVSFVIPLLMVAAGFGAIFKGRIDGIAWLVGAGVASRVGTGLLRRAEGMKFNRLKSGELLNRAMKMANHMGVTIGRVYIVPAGKGHLTNAYGLSNAIGLTDNLGKFLTRTQMDYVMAHELAHVKLKHGRKHLLVVVVVFSILTLLLFRFSQHALSLQPLVQVAAIFVPLVAIYYFSRRFEYAADGMAVDFTGEPETAIRALTNLRRLAFTSWVPQSGTVAKANPGGITQ